MAFANVRRIILKHKRGIKCPLLKKFLTECVESDAESFIATCDIFDAYENAVSLWTDGDSVHGQTQFLIKRNAFNQQLKKIILCPGRWDVRPDIKDGRRGYVGIKLRRVRRTPIGYEFGGRLMQERIADYMTTNPPPAPPIKCYFRKVIPCHFPENVDYRVTSKGQLQLTLKSLENDAEIHDVPSDPRGAGRCAFACRDVERGEVVVEYVGEVISMSEAATREVRYADVGKICTLMVIESRGDQIAIDPYYGNEEGEPTWGATINHSLHNANLRPFVVDRNSEKPRVFFVALHDIPETVEFLWNYNDTNWEFHADSQTIPSTED